MTEISFYHLSVSPLEKAMPRLLEKVVATGKRAILLAENDEKVEIFNDLLWTYTTRTFLPHGSKKDGFASEQPIFLTASNENPNGATFVVVTAGIEPNDLNNFERCLDIFDGTDEEQLQKARTRWSKYKQAGHTLTYWKQTSDGGWEKGN